MILQNETKHRIEVEKQYNIVYSKLIGNEGKFHQAMLNVIANAVQSIENKGKIMVSTQLVGKKMEIDIKDSGYGIRSENMGKIFDPFFTTKAPGKGTGLGLAVIYKVINEHKGSISIESEFGKDSNVKILLPVNLKLSAKKLRKYNFKSKGF